MKKINFSILTLLSICLLSCESSNISNESNSSSISSDSFNDSSFSNDIISNSSFEDSSLPSEDISSDFSDSSFEDSSLPSEVISSDVSDSSFEDSSLPSEVISSDISDSFENNETLKYVDESILNEVNTHSINILFNMPGSSIVYKDIGSFSNDINDPQYDSYKYHPEDIESEEIARFFAPAAIFKKIFPGVTINIQTKDSNIPLDPVFDYFNIVSNYGSNFKSGKLVDLSKYKNFNLYKMYDEYYLSRFNYGGFQVAFPHTLSATGTYVNLDDLYDYSIIDSHNDYKKYVDNFTYQSLIDSSKELTTDTHASLFNMEVGNSKYILSNIYDKYINDNKVDFISNQAKENIEKFLQYENELSKYCIYEYNENSTGTVIKDNFSNIQYWNKNKYFMVDEYYTFATIVNPIEHIQNYINMYNISFVNDQINPNIDILPYPKLNDNDESKYSIDLDGLAIRDLSKYGVEESKAEIENALAATFVMFMALDPRAIEAKDKMTFYNEGIKLKGVNTLPLCKQNAKLYWQTDEQYSNFYNPAKEFDDNFKYQLNLWLNDNKVFLTDEGFLELETELKELKDEAKRKSDELNELLAKGSISYVMTVDGWYGDATKKAVKKFQTDFKKKYKLNTRFTLYCYFSRMGTT